MAEGHDQIARLLEQKSEDLRSNLEELEDKVRGLTDWRRQFRNHTALMLGAGFACGLILSRLIGSRGRDVELRNQRSAQHSRPVTESVEHKVYRSDAGPLWDGIQRAVVGVAASGLTGALGRLFEVRVHRGGTAAGRPSNGRDAAPR